jgi:two-component system response regulator WspF
VTVGIINQLAAVGKLLERLVSVDPVNRVLWIALDGATALDLCARQTPDLLLMDLTMPIMDGVEMTRRVMASTPTAILLVTRSVRVSSAQVFQAIGYGALDAIDTPQSGRGTIEDLAWPLLARMATISRVIGTRRGAPAGAALPVPHAKVTRHDTLIAIGASAGGPAVLATLLHELPEHFRAAVVIVQHVDEQFAAGMASWLNEGSALPVRIAREGDRPTVGHVLLAASSDHLTLKSADRLGYTARPADYVYRPSVDVFFQSACRFWRGDVVGVLLTGMGRDGALGLKALRDGGHYTIAQDQATSAVYGMPKAAAAINAAVDILPAARIASRLVEVVSCYT